MLFGVDIRNIEISGIVPRSIFKAMAVTRSRSAKGEKKEAKEAVKKPTKAKKPKKTAPKKVEKEEVTENVVEGEKVVTIEACKS